MNPQQKGLKSATVWLMVGVALFLDGIQILLQFIPLVGQTLGWLIVGVEYGTYIFWFRLHGISFLSIKRAPTLGIGALVEMATAGIFPAFTAVVARIAFTSKIKEVAGSGSIGKVVGSIRPRMDSKNTEMAT